MNLINQDMASFSQNLQVQVGSLAPTFEDTFQTLSLYNYQTGAMGKWRLGGRSYQEGGYADNQYTWDPSPFAPGTPDLYMAKLVAGGVQLSIDNTPSNLLSACGNCPYIAAWMDTRGLWSQTYGYWEASIAVSLPAGCSSAFWLQPEDGSWPPEIDMTEFDSQPGGLDTVNGIFSPSTQTNLSNWYYFFNSRTTGQHTYAVDWQQDFTTFYFDGVQTTQIATPTTDYAKPMYIILSMIIPGPNDFVGPVDPTTLPATMTVEYVRAYLRKP